MRYKIEISKLKNGYIEAKLIDAATNHPIEFRICDTEQYVQSQIADWHKRFRMNEPKEDDIKKQYKLSSYRIIHKLFYFIIWEKQKRFL